MIRVSYLLCFLLSSCSGIPSDFYKESYLNIKSMLVRAELDSSKNFYDEFEYSYASISIGNSGQSIIVLSSIDNGIYEWVSEDGILIYTHNGKIVQTIGLQYDSRFVAATPKWADEFESNIQLDLYNPDALSLMGKQYITFNGIVFTNRLERPIEVSEYVESITIDAIKWRSINKYLMDQDGLVIQSTQKIHPYLPEIEIHYFLKY